MLQHAEKTTISLKPEQRQALTEMAHQEGQELDVLIEHILQEAIEKKSPHRTVLKDERIRQNYDRIREHREAFLAKRNNSPLAIDTVALLEQIRDEHDEHLLSLITNHRR